MPQVNDDPTTVTGLVVSEWIESVVDLRTNREAVIAFEPEVISCTILTGTNNLYHQKYCGCLVTTADATDMASLVAKCKFSLWEDASAKDQDMPAPKYNQIRVGLVNYGIDQATVDSMLPDGASMTANEVAAILIPFFRDQ